MLQLVSPSPSHSHLPLDPHDELLVRRLLPHLKDATSAIFLAHYFEKVEVVRLDPIVTPDLGLEVRVKFGFLKL
jgi:hypothetical protein